MIRKFRLINGEGVSWDLNARTSFSIPLAASAIRTGRSMNRSARTSSLWRNYSHRVMTGRIFFGGRNAYVNYRAFSRFVRAVPLTLVYEMEEAFRVPVRMTEIAKSELITGGAGLDCEVAFTATGCFIRMFPATAGRSPSAGKSTPYEYTYAYADVTQNTLMIDSDSHGDSPCRVTVYGPCTNPYGSTM